MKIYDILVKQMNGNYEGMSGSFTLSVDLNMLLDNTTRDLDIKYRNAHELEVRGREIIEEKNKIITSLKDKLSKTEREFDDFKKDAKELSALKCREKELIYMVEAYSRQLSEWYKMSGVYESSKMRDKISKLEGEKSDLEHQLSFIKDTLHLKTYYDKCPLIEEKDWEIQYLYVKRGSSITEGYKPSMCQRYTKPEGFCIYSIRYKTKTFYLGQTTAFGEITNIDIIDGEPTFEAKNSTHIMSGSIEYLYHKENNNQQI